MSHDSLVEKEEYKGYRIELHLDFDPLNPRTEWDNFGTMVFFHRGYDLGDKHSYSIEDLKEIVNGDDYFTLPVYMYEHSGITISTGRFSCQWDSGQLGHIIVSKEAAKKEFPNLSDSELEERVYTLLQGEVETYDHYLTGSVYGFVVKDKTGEEIESCWGFYGDSDYPMQEAKSTVDYLVKKNKEDLEANEFDNHYGLA